MTEPSTPGTLTLSPQENRINEPWRGSKEDVPAGIRQAWGQAGPDYPQGTPWNPQPQTQYLAPRWLSCRKQLHRPALDLKERNTTLVTGRTRQLGRAPSAACSPSAPTLTAYEWGAMSIVSTGGRS